MDVSLPRASFSLGRKKLGFLICFGAILLVVPFMPINNYQIFILEGALIWGIYAISYNLLLGYTGLLSFGHGLLVGSGAYSAALLMQYTGIQSFWLLLLISIGAAILVSMAVGALCVRYTSIYFTMLTLAFAQLGALIVIKFGDITGGSNGVAVGVPSLFGVEMGMGNFDFAISYLFYITVFILVLTILLFYIIVNSPFGKTLQSIRENPTRARFLGISVMKYRWISFVITGAFAGMAGALYAFMRGWITPSMNIMIGFQASSHVVFAVLIGGVGTFIGPLVGAFVFEYLWVYVPQFFEFKQFVIGAIVIAVVILFRRGIVGELKPRLKKWL